MHNRIEKSGFRAGEYAGYCDGPWRIRRVSGLWEARKNDGADYFRASTFEKIGTAQSQKSRATEFACSYMTL